MHRLKYEYDWFFIFHDITARNILEEEYVQHVQYCKDKSLIGENIKEIFLVSCHSNLDFNFVNVINEFCKYEEDIFNNLNK